MSIFGTTQKNHLKNKMKLVVYYSSYLQRNVFFSFFFKLENRMDNAQSESVLSLSLPNRSPEQH